MKKNEQGYLIGSEQVDIERKTFVVARRQNARGDFLRVTEWSGEHKGRPNTIVVPASGVKNLAAAMVRLATLGEDL